MMILTSLRGVPERIHVEESVFRSIWPCRSANALRRFGNQLARKLVVNSVRSILDVICNN